MLHERILVLIKYVTDVIAGKNFSEFLLLAGLRALHRPGQA